jgi:MFS family permease
MLRRFCLYGFLKNQLYFEPFLILIFRQKGLSFAAIGLLVAFREICINLLEIPTGAVADVLGRRRAMMVSFVAYIGAFLLFGLSGGLGGLFPAMLLFAVGEAFRTGTHKAIIFEWLACQGREQEKTAIYGLTRSWSKLGSAVCMPLAALVVFLTGLGPEVFYVSIIPCLLNLVNFAGYPQELDGQHEGATNLAEIARTLLKSVRTCIRQANLRRLLLESMVFEGLYKSGKDYLQPVLQTTALAMPFFLALSTERRTAVVIGGVYFLLHLLSSLASRHAGSLVRHCGSEHRATLFIWGAEVAGFALLLTGVLASAKSITIAAFLLLAVLQNLWRPILVSRCATLSERGQMATILSVESQAKSIFVAVVAPLLGWSIDRLSLVAPDWRFLPLALLGLILPAIMLLSARHAN